jgi:hypothetical protein
MLGEKNIITRAKTSSSNPYNDAESTSVEQEQREKNNQLFDVNMAEITPSALNDNPCTSIAIDSGSENRLNNKTFLPCKRFYNGQTHENKF